MWGLIHRRVAETRRKKIDDLFCRLCGPLRLQYFAVFAVNHLERIFDVIFNAKSAKGRREAPRREDSGVLELVNVEEIADACDRDVGGGVFGDLFGVEGVVALTWENCGHSLFPNVLDRG